MARVVGLVLAGGRSTRFGSEKAMAQHAGEPLVAHVARALGRGGGTVAVNARADSGAAAWARAHGLPLVSDPEGAADGPLAGVLAGLDWALAERGGFLLTSPCDTPRLPQDFRARLLAAGAPAVARTAAGPHPLCALWPVEARPALAAALEGGRHPSVRAFLTGLGAREVAFDDADAFLNANTPAELARAAGEGRRTTP